MKRLLASVSIAAMMIAAAPAFADMKQGGEMTVTFKDDLITLDPAIGYDWKNWSVIKSVFDGLMDYKPGTTELVPDLAESFEVSDDGLTYTFKLRQGVKFHNGREMTAADVKYSLERTCNPATQSPGAGYYGALKGFDDFQGGKATELAGVQAVDDYTVKIELSRPDFDDLPSTGAQLLLRCAEGGGGSRRPRFRPQTSRNRCIQGDGMDLRAVAHA